MTFERENLTPCPIKIPKADQSPGLVRFVPKGDDKAVLIGQPVDGSVDVGAAVRKGDEVKVKVFSGTSALNPGSLTDKIEVIHRVLSPLTMEEVGTIRCIGLNVGITQDQHTITSG